MNVPVAVGVPLIVITSAAHTALTPAGKPFAAANPGLLMPVAPVVVWVIFVNGVFKQEEFIVGIEYSNIWSAISPIKKNLSPLLLKAKDLGRPSWALIINLSESPS